MRKRIRKKKHLGEFRQMGFSVECRFRSGFGPTEFDQFMDEFIDQAIEAHNLLFGGGGSPERGWDGVVSRNDRYASTIEADRHLVETWLRRRAEVVSCRVSTFWDLWHGVDPFESEISGRAAAGNAG